MLWHNIHNGAAIIDPMLLKPCKACLEAMGLQPIQENSPCIEISDSSSDLSYTQSSKPATDKNKPKYKKVHLAKSSQIILSAKQFFKHWLHS